jgi:hypothetical protein
MAGRTFGEDFRNDMAGKAIMWGPAIAGALLLGNPVGILLGLVASVSIVASGGRDNSSPPAGDQGTK